MKTLLNTEYTKANEDVGQKEFSFIANANEKWYSHLRVWFSLTKLNILLYKYNLAIVLHVIYSRR